MSKPTCRFADPVYAEMVLAVGFLHDMHAGSPGRVQDVWRGGVFDWFRDIASSMNAVARCQEKLGMSPAFEPDVVHMLRQLDELNKAAGIRARPAEPGDQVAPYEDEDDLVHVLREAEFARASDDVD